MTSPPPARIRVWHEGPEARLWFVGAVRLALLALVAAGAYLLGDLDQAGADYLVLFYVFGVLSSLWYLLTLRRKKPVQRLLTVTQLLVDFGMVAATVGFTGGSTSHFLFLFVVVILEAGLLLGPAPGYVFATLAAAYCLGQTSVQFREATDYTATLDLLALWYDLLIQCLAYYLTASISGYYNQRVNRMQQFQREILDNMNNGFLIADRNGTVTVLNTAGSRILGLQEYEGIGRPLSEVLRAASGSECPVMTALRLGADFTSYEFRALVGKDREKLLGLSTSRLYDSRGRLRGILASFADLTEVEAMRTELQRQDRLATVGELAAGLAHEIRNPVAAIRGAVDELQHTLASPPLAKRLSAIAMRESDHLNRIVTDFLDFAREPVLQREVFDVCQVVKEVRDLLRDKEDGLIVDLKLPDEPCPISGDRLQIKQVCANIAKNASEAMNGRGRLTVTVEPGPVAVEIRFDDEGPGIDPDKVVRIFEPFYTTKESGIGMGLAVCQRIVTAHDGTIRAESRERGGASMSIRLPLAQREE